MRTITKIMAVAAIAAVAVPGVTFAHGSDGNRGNDRGGIDISINAENRLKLKHRLDNKLDKLGDHQDRIEDRLERLGLNVTFWIGTVTAKETNSMTLSASNGTTYTINTSGAQFVSKHGATMSLGDVQVNDKVYIQGTVNGSVITAAKVFEWSQEHRSKAKGEVTAVNGSTITVQTKNRGAVSVATNADTQVKLQGGTIGSMANVTVGSKVMVRGTWSEANVNILAKLIKVK